MIVYLGQGSVSLWIRSVLYALVLVTLTICTSALAATKMVFISQFDEVTMVRLAPVFQEFAAAHNVEWECMQVPWDQLVEKVSVMSAAGVSPDVIRIGTNYAPLAAAGLFTDLGPYIKRDKIDVTQFHQAAYQAFNWHGQQLGLPTATANYAVYYNMDMFDAAGMAYPPTNWKTDRWTYDEMAAVAAKLARDDNGDGKAEVFGAQWGFREWRFWAWASGKDLANAELTRANLDDKDIIKAVDHVAQLQLNTRFFSGGTFSGGTASMWVDASWSLNSLATAPFRIDFAVLPRLEERYGFLYPNNVMMFQASKNKELAWQFIKYVTYNQRGAFAWDAATTRVPALKSVAVPYIELQKNLFPNAHNAVWIDGLSYAKPDPFSFSPYGNQITKLLDNEMKQVTSGKVSAAALMPQLAAQVTALLQGK